MAHCTNELKVKNGGDVTTVLLVGNPNVGKSVIFHGLTGAYVDVSNYPGTTIAVAKATLKNNQQILIDSPGVLTLPSQSEDERVTIKALLADNCRVIIQVGDAKNLRRTLALTAILAEFSLPMILVLNMYDEALSRGIVIDIKMLSQELGIAVIPTIATKGFGLQELNNKISEAIFHQQPQFCKLMLHYDTDIESVINKITKIIKTYGNNINVSSRSLALLSIENDSECLAYLEGKLAVDKMLVIKAEINLLNQLYEQSPQKLPEIMACERAQTAQLLTKKCLSRKAESQPLLSHKLGQLTVHPLWSIPILLMVLFICYEFVGVFGAEYLVGLLEDQLMGEYINPIVISFVNNLSPYKWLANLFVGEYGLWTMGITYALALILPIVTTFFIIFSILEDSGYLPRLSVLLNRIFKVIGLNGNAVLPMILGLGCVTMATMTTRILRSPRERLITTFLLALAVPCSAQLGVVLGLLGGIGFMPLLIWMVAITVIMLFSGFLASKLIKGKRIALVTEMPPIRLPIFGNVVKKTFSRLKWYLVEVVPLFLIGSLLMFLLDVIGVLPFIIKIAEPVVSGWLGLPKEAAAAFVMGFLRRDFGATGLFAIAGGLTAVQAVVGVITLTLFVPCIASFLMIYREHGIKATLIICGVIVPLAFFIGGIFNIILSFTGVGV